MTRNAPLPSTPLHPCHLGVNVIIQVIDQIIEEFIDPENQSFRRDPFHRRQRYGSATLSREGSSVTSHLDTQGAIPSILQVPPRRSGGRG